jgi:putative redox protein
MKYKMEKPVEGTIGTVKYQCTITWRNGKFLSDEPESTGGKDTGPDPFTLLLSSLASCTLITLRMYIDRQQLDIPEIAVKANMYQEIKNGQTVTVIDRDVQFLGPVTEEVKTKLVEIAGKCPISKLLENDIKVRTFVFRDSETEKVVRYSNEDITVEWRPEYCQHSTRCWKQLLPVFNPQLKKWINVDGAPADRIREQVARCPSGALAFRDHKKEATT